MSVSRWCFAPGGLRRSSTLIGGGPAGLGLSFCAVRNGRQRVGERQVFISNGSASVALALESSSEHKPAMHRRLQYAQPVSEFVRLPSCWHRLAIAHAVLLTASRPARTRRR